MTDGADEVPPLTLEDAERILARLEDVVRERKVVLIGGQAVAVWVAQLADRLPSLEVEQVASRDVDFLGGRADVQRAAALLDAKVTVARPWKDRMNPLSGIAVFLDSQDNERRLDFMRTAHGMDSGDIRDSAVQLEIESDGRVIALWVMHPERCLESRVYNTELPNKQTPLARRQLDASIACARAYSEFLLDNAGEEGEKAVRKLDERVFKLAEHRTGLKLYSEQGVDVTAAAILADPRLSEQFVAQRVPQLRVRLESRRSSWSA